MPKRKIDGAPDAEQATTMACTLRCFLDECEDVAA
jgi:hypothetical protein